MGEHEPEFPDKDDFSDSQSGEIFVSGNDTVSIDLPWNPDKLYIGFDDPDEQGDARPSCAPIAYDVAEGYTARVFRWWTTPKVIWELHLYWNVAGVRKLIWFAAKR